MPNKPVLIFAVPKGRLVGVNGRLRKSLPGGVKGAGIFMAVKNVRLFERKLVGMLGGSPRRRSSALQPLEALAGTGASD